MLPQCLLLYKLETEECEEQSIVRREEAFNEMAKNFLDSHMTVVVFLEQKPL